MGMTYSDSNAYTLLGNAANTLDDAKANYVAAQAEVDNATALRNSRKLELDAAYAAYIPCIQNFDCLLATPPDGYNINEPAPRTRIPTLTAPPATLGSSTLGSSTLGSSTLGSSTLGSSTLGSSTPPAAPDDSKA